ncbi:unnamed protein product, partial [Musa acuminata subsp. burmannicoides]
LSEDNFDSLFRNLMDLSNSVAEHEEVEKEWVIVKKQRIVILIPPPSPVDQPESPEANSTKSTKIIRRSSGNPKKRGRRLSNSRSYKPTATISKGESHIEVELKPSAKPSENGTQTDGERLGYQRSLQNLVSPVAIGTTDNIQHHASRMPLMQHAPLTHELINGNCMVYSKMQTFMFSRKTGGIPRLPIGMSKVANWRLRALNLERKLQILGGLRTWLVSAGLGQFIHIFEKEKVGIYQLVNLTMSKLKDMGADAVGPRRKLIHAIECLCNPYYTEECSN